MNCSYCQQPVVPSARFCPNCGKLIPASLGPAGQVSGKPSVESGFQAEGRRRRARKAVGWPMMLAFTFGALVIAVGGTYLTVSHLMRPHTATVVGSAATDTGTGAGIGTGTGSAHGSSGASPTVQTTTLPQLIQHSLPSVVLLTVTHSSGQDLGTGFICDSLGDILTNAHVVNGATSINVKAQNGHSYTGTLIGIDAVDDVALVRVPALATVPPLTLGDSKSVALGDSVVAIGSPLGLKDTVTTGVISGMNRNFTIGTGDYRNMLQISAPIAPGNSGGPLLLETTGQVIGINTAGTNTTGNIGFSIPINHVKSLVSTWSKNPESPQQIQSALGATGGGTGGSSSSAGGGGGNGTGGGGSGSGSGSSASNGSTLAQQALTTLNDFYGYVNNRDYLDAFNLLGQKWQQSTSYTAFADGYATTLSSTVENPVVVSSSTNSAEITCSLVAQSRNNNGRINQTVYHMDYIFGIENGQIRIEHGTGTVVGG